jgi:peptidyl-prolyl cis-trans isomerase D
VGSISDVQDVEDSYVIAVMTEEIPEGVKPFELVKDEIRPLAKNEVVATQIINKLKGKTDALETLVEQFGRDAVVKSSSDLKLSSNSMVSVGFDPVAVGKAFSLENGKRSEPFKGENGVLVVEMINKSVAPEIADYTSYKNQLTQTMSGRSSYTISEALKDAAKIQDKRYKFF